MPSILDIGFEHLAGALEGEPDSLRALFAARLAGWGKPYAHEEHITVGLFADVEEEMESPVAFAAIETAVNLAMAQSQEESLLCALSLLQSVVNATHTTEVPPPLRLAFPPLLSVAQSMGSSQVEQELAALRRYYRNAL